MFPADLTAFRTTVIVILAVYLFYRALNRATRTCRYIYSSLRSFRQLCLSSKLDVAGSGVVSDKSERVHV